MYSKQNNHSTVLTPFCRSNDIGFFFLLSFVRQYEHALFAFYNFLSGHLFIHSLFLRDLNNMEKGFHKEPVEQDDMIVQEKARHIRHRRSTPTDIVIQLRPEVTSHEVTGLEKGAKYCITLRANTSAGNGVTSNCVNQMTPITGKCTQC